MNMSRAITPDEIRKKIDDQIPKLIEFINKELEKNYKGEGRVIISINDNNHPYDTGKNPYTEYNKEKIKNIFNKAGWKKVTFHSDQRDGEWIEFEA